MTQRIALLSDIHGNAIALDAVLADARAQCPIDTWWILGDLVAIGPDPVGVLERIAALPNARCLRGNTDRFVATGERPPPTSDEAAVDPSLLPILIEVVGSFSWTHGAVAATGWLPWLAELPFEQRMVLPDGTRVLGVHATPDSDDGLGLHPAMSESELRQRLGDCAADLVFAGHTHTPMDAWAGDIRAVNLGSVSNPVSTDLRASYVLLNADASGYRLAHRRVAYDYEAVVAATRRVRHPGAAFITRFFQGAIRPGWQQEETR